LEVALSLKTRNNFSISKSMLLWLRHVLDAEYSSRGIPRCFLSYEELLRDWRRQVDRICRQTGLVLPHSFAGFGEVVDQFLTAELYHEHANSVSAEYSDEISQLARNTFRLLLALCVDDDSEEVFGQLDKARAEFDRHCRSIESAIFAENIEPFR
jgi:hypothetical protein